MDFDIGKWLAKIINEPGNFKILYDFSTSKKHLDDHTINRCIISSESSKKIVADLTEDARRLVLDSYNFFCPVCASDFV